MARTYLVFGDIDGKLDVLRVECARCQRKGRYSVRRLIEKYGRNANMMKWKEQLNGDCPRRDSPQMHDRCDLVCPEGDLAAFPQSSEWVAIGPLDVTRSSRVRPNQRGAAAIGQHRAGMSADWGEAVLNVALR
jgi:hypothetical protein